MLITLPSTAQDERSKANVVSLSNHKLSTNGLCEHGAPNFLITLGKELLNDRGSIRYKYDRLYVAC